MRDRPVIANINPRDQFVQLGIRNPAGIITEWRPMFQYCITPTITTLGPNSPALYESVYVGYSKMEGVLFNQPGTYYIRGIYFALDGSQVTSNILPVIVDAPTNAEDQKVSHLLNDLPQTKLFHLLGSYSPSLSKGNEAFDEILQNYRDHRLATYAEFVQGIRAATNYKTITDGKVAISRKADLKKSIDLLSSAVEDKKKAKEFGNITRGDIMRVLAVERKAIGDEKGAKSTVTQMINTLSSAVKNEAVIRHVEEQAKRSLEVDLRSVMSSIYYHTT